ncbi:hypothetical protein HQ529_01210 [Candidatus Woesearchaeota archaeon]|nr:hypothetical protein [Candidatus Woesearchaeota archaeon]
MESNLENLTCKKGAIDTEIVDYQTVNPIMFLASLNTDIDVPVIFDWLGNPIENNELEKIIGNDKNIKNFTFGLYNIEQNTFFPPDNDEEAQYILIPQQNPMLLRRAFSNAIFNLNIENLNGQNLTGFDIGKLSSPRRDLDHVREGKFYKGRVVTKTIEKFCNEPDGFFIPNPDNTSPKYKGKSWREFQETVQSCKDTMNFSNNFRTLLRSLKLGDLHGLLDFFYPDIASIGKYYSSYDIMTKDAHKARKGDVPAALNGAIYVHLDNMVHQLIYKHYERISDNIANDLEMDSERVFNDSVSADTIAELFWNREITHRFGIFRSKFETKDYHKYKVDFHKRKLFEKALKNENKVWKSLDWVLETEESEDYKGLIDYKSGSYEKVSVFMMPMFAEGFKPLIRNFKHLEKLYTRYKNSDDMLERVASMRILESMLIEPILDLQKVQTNQFSENEFEQKYHIDVEQLIKSVDVISREIVASLRDKNDIITYVGEPQFAGCFLFTHKNEGLEKILEQSGFLHVGDGNLISMSRYLNFFSLKKQGSVDYVASTGARIISGRDRFSEDKKYYFEPFFYSSLIYDISHFHLEAMGTIPKEYTDNYEKYKDKENIIDIVVDLTRGINKNTLPVSEYIGHIRPGYEIEDFSSRYHSFKRYQIAKKLRIKQGEDVHFLVVEKENEDEIDAVRIDPENPEKLENYTPSRKYYLQLMFEKGRRLDLLLDALYLSNPKYAPAGIKFMIQTLNSIKRGDHTDKEIDGFKNVYKYVN